MVDIGFDATKNVALCGGESLVFHCHFYNCALQKAIEDGMGVDAAPLLERAAAEVLATQLRSLAQGGAAVFDTATELFRTLGFGVLQLDGVGADGGTAVVAASHYAMGWTAVHGERETPVCHFPAGFVHGAVCAAHDLSLDAVRVREATCFATGAEDCRFTVERV